MANLEYDLSWNVQSVKSIVTDDAGKNLNHQWVAGSSEAGNRIKLLVQAELPSMGYRQIKVSSGTGNEKLNTLNYSTDSIENEYFRLSFNTDGSVRVFDKIEKAEIFTKDSEGFQALIIDDPSDTWSHDIKSFSKVIGKFSDTVLTLLEKGPLRVRMRSLSKYNSSVLTINWSLYSGIKTIEAKVSLDWHERLKMLKFSFPAAVDSPSAVYETAYGTIQRAVNGDEDPGQRWVDIEGTRDGKVRGLAVINDAKYGYSVHGSDLRISVARSAVYAHHNPKVLDMNAEHLWMDQGIQTFRMLMVPHSGRWNDVNIPRIAEEFSAPAPVIYQGIHGGKLPASGSFLSTSSENVIISAMKKSESGDTIIIRCVETLGMEGSAKLDLKFADITYECRFSPYEIKTLGIDRNTGKVSELNLLEEFV
jgi:alpha-mannosidase